MSHPFKWACSATGHLTDTPAGQILLPTLGSISHALSTCPGMTKFPRVLCVGGVALTASGRERTAGRCGETRLSVKRKKKSHHRRKLHCTRNLIHANLFLSLILRAVSVIVKDTMLERHWGREIIKQTDVREMLSHQAAIGCRVAQVMMQYCVLANHYWFFGEAIHLYSVLIASVFIDNNKYLPYICLGWGTPLVFVAPWVVMKLLKENKECWAVNENMNYWWIIRFPILFASLINFLIFIKILKVILSKLRDRNQSGYPDYKLRLAKATLTLIPLFGIHEIVFIFATDEQTTGILRYVKVFFTLFLNSFQGFLVAVLYCYANKEVRTELKRKLRSWRIESETVCCGQ
ncbi:glucagon receptor-like isoform X4 [Micropterus dolomieu]|uniref:glucagon receptor-like isoform X4 n=1 Tax=Micropterus dolomieu TaxID=147949 RepID=UPI001E8D0FF9|nr:glucagon receptor-like isoform X4 [Micropterus dolomieu]